MDFTPKFNRNIFQILLRDLARHEHFNTRQLWEDEKKQLEKNLEKQDKKTR